ncbi:MAG TPA: hypothetical protein PLD23_06680 [Armatimonadota bacterium]|nr:hypothetical protein [Armatimonadota bacterium]HQK93171.1 hypothetical protein [Armatimonadota bacterium]
MLARPRYGVTLATLLAIWAAVPALGAEPSASQILKRALDLNSGIVDYTARARAEFHAPEGADVPEGQRSMVFDFRVLFKRPNQVKIEANQPVMLPRQLFAFGNLGTTIAREGRVSLVGKRVVDGVPIYNVQVAPPEGTEGAKMLFWIHGAKWTVLRMKMPASGGNQQSFELDIAWTYARVQGYYVPTRISVSLPGMMFGPNVWGQGRASLTMTDWRINVGLKDSVFAR